LPLFSKTDFSRPDPQAFPEFLCKELQQYFAVEKLLTCAKKRRELCTTPLFVMPAKAGIQEAIDNTGFPPSRE
jgi:hypothetical protein